jgi:peptide/nickel transport system ATP-binding protein
MPEAREPVLTVSGLRVVTAGEDVILDHVSLRAFPGELLALVGESGSGKTTLALACLGHCRPGTKIAAGSVSLRETELLSLTQAELRAIRGARISYVSQDPAAALNPRQRIGDQIGESMRVHGRSKAVADAELKVLFERVGLPSDPIFARRFPFELSGGQQQRVVIAMALACEPDVVVLDEPTTGLDVTTQARLLKVIAQIQREGGSAFVFVTHDLSIVDGLADRVCVMYSGLVVETGSRDQVLRAPAHPYTSMLLASVPRMSVRHRLSGIAGSAPPPGARPRGCPFTPRCPIAIGRCAEEFPPVATPEPGHRALCWRPAECVTPLPELVSEDRRSRTVPLLSVEDLSASYGHGSRRHEVLHEVSLAISRGESLALVGETGSGKTTIGRCIAGLHEPDRGRILLDSELLPSAARERTKDQRRAIQIVFQNPNRSLNPRETVGRAIERPLRLFDPDRASRRAEVVRLLERVQLPSTVLGRYPRELSGGQRQRVALARALAPGPELIVCDEITSSLDVSIQAAIASVLDELRADGLTLLFITHNLALVNCTTDRVLVLQDGEVKETGPTGTVIKRPRDPYTQELVASVPELRLPERNPAA